jgi:hypothetical protein
VPGGTQTLTYYLTPIAKFFVLIFSASSWPDSSNSTNFSSGSLSWAQQSSFKTYQKTVWVSAGFWCRVAPANFLLNDDCLAQDRLRELKLICLEPSGQD